MAHDKRRRSFIATVGSMAALALFGESGAAEAMPLPQQQKDGKWDLSWIEGLKGKHRQVFDFGSRDLSVGGNPLRIPRNYMNAHNTVSGLPDSELNTVVGIASAAFAMNASDRLWKEYALGEHYKIKDPATDKWAERNVYIDASMPPTSSIKTMLARGTIFWQCNNALNGTADELATKVKKPTSDVRADLVAGLNPWVKLVPAHTMLLGLLQERGFTYEKI